VDQLLWKRIGDLFAAARLLNGEGRIAFLKENCGQDQELFEQVMALLDVDSKPGLLDSAPTVSALCVPQVIAGRFRIIRYIAEGGMGTVYEAEDVTLHDRVALKTIRPDIASHPRAVERFKREILLGKKVTHPNVCRIHDLGVDHSETGAEFLFLTMQFLPGETLASRIKRGPIPRTEALPLIEDMADALSAAHQVDVIHRDFKSSNVMLVSGPNRTCAVVTDFGLARGLHDDSSRTHAGMVGTVDYMAPEQIRGEELTPAADIYALGIVMYEMVTGQRPFTGDSKVTIALKHLNDQPHPLRDVAPHLDPNWEETILCCLRKPPLERFQSAAEVKDALVHNGAGPRRRITSRRPKPVLLAAIAMLLFAIASLAWFYRGWVALPSQKHIAVLPFQNIGNDTENQAFSDGVVESLTSKLSQLERYQKSFWVVPSSDSRQVKSLDDAYRKLNVTLAITGSIQHTAKEVILTANLVDAKNHKQLASRTIRATSADLDGLQDRVWESVADMVDLEVSPEVARVVNAGGTQQPGVYELYEQGVGYAQRYDVDDIDRAIGLFTKALSKDPEYALAYAGLGSAYASKYALTKDPQWIDKAKSNGQRALALGDHLVPVHVTLGEIYQQTGDIDRARAEFQQALDLDPAAIYASYRIGEIYEAKGKITEAEEVFKSVLHRRPGYWAGYSGLGAFYYRHGEFQKAAQQFQTMIDLQPDNSMGYFDLGGVYGAMGRYDDAIDVLKKGLTFKETSRAWTNLGAVYMYLKRYPEAADAMERATNLDPHNDILWRNLGDSYRQIPSRTVDANLAYQRALQTALEELKVNPHSTEVLSGVALYQAHLGRKREAEDYIKKALTLTPKDGDILFTSALVYEIIGRRDNAIAAIDQAVKAGYSIQEIEQEPELKELRSDPRYQRWAQNRSEKTRASPT
jgi:serine/threonine protein kinase/tetratricopeptide (TPR) repeat protein